MVPKLIMISRSAALCYLNEVSTFDIFANVASNASLDSDSRTTTLLAAWSFGLVMGTGLGGILAEPATNFPSVFSESGIFGRLKPGAEEMLL